MTRMSMLSGVVCSMSALALQAMPAHAAPLVQADFDGNATGSLYSQNANATGLTGAWSTGSTLDATVTAGNLAFSTLNPAGTGNRLVVSTTKGSSANAKLDLASTISGTLWHSSIFKITDPTAGNGSGTFAEVSRIGSAHDSNGSSSRFRVLVDGTGTSSSNSKNLAVSYSGSTKTTSVAPALDTAYLVITRLTNVNEELSPTNSGVASLFVLAENQYASFAQSADSEAYLDAATQGTGTNQLFAKISSDAITSGTYAFVSDNYLMMSGVGAADDPYTAEYDRILYGTSLNAVVPEPAGMSLALLAGAAVALRRRRVGA